MSGYGSALQEPREVAIRPVLPETKTTCQRGSLDSALGKVLPELVDRCRAIAEDDDVRFLNLTRREIRTAQSVLGPDALESFLNVREATSSCPPDMFNVKC